MRQLGPLLLGLAFSSVALAADTPEKPILVLDSGGHTAIVFKVLFTRDGKQLISVSQDKTIRVWDVASGAPLRVLRPPIGPIAGGQLIAAALTPDGRTLAAAGSGWRLGEVPIYLIDLATGRILRVLKGHTNGITSLAFSPDGERLASGSYDRTSRIWSAVSGRCERVLEGHEDVVCDVAFAPDGRRLATASFDKTGRIWSLIDGRCEAVLRGHEKEVKCVAWRPDGQVVATGGFDGSIRQWSPDGSALRGFEHMGGQISSLTFSADSQTLLFGRGGLTPPCTCSLLDLATGKERVRFGLHSNTVQDGALSPDGTLAATTGGNDHETFIWRLTDAAVVHRIAGHGRRVWAVAWDPDGESLAWGNTGKSISHNDRGPLERAFRLAGLELSDELSPDLRRATPTLGTLRLELAGTALVVKEGVDTVATFKMADPRNRILCYTLLPGDRAAVGADYGLYLFDARSGKQLRTFVGHSSEVFAIAPSPDGRYLLSGSADQTLRIWELAGNKGVIASDKRAGIGIRIALEGEHHTIRGITPGLPVSRDKRLQVGDRIIAIAQFGEDFVELKGKTIPEVSTMVRGVAGTTVRLRASRDGVDGTREYEFKREDLSQASTPILSIFAAGDDWVAWSPAGYYAASPGGEQLMGWHVNNGPDAMASYYPASQFRKTLYRPDVIKRLLGTGNVKKALAAADAASGQNTREIDVAEVLPPKVAIITPTVAKLELNGNSLEVKAVASSVGDHAVTTLRLLLDGRPAPEGLKIFTEPKLGEVGASWTLEVPPGSHRLTVQASNAVSKSVSDPVEVVAVNNGNPAAASGSLYVLAVGINDYPDKRLKLDCAAPDAQSLRKAFLTNSSKLFRGVEVKLLLNGQATRASILEGLQWLSSSVKPGDMAVVFYAGHGDCKIEGQFYLVPVDANLRDLSHTAISGEALKKAIGELPCTTMLLLDACYAGSFDGKKRKKRSLPAESDAVLRQLVYDAGLVVMCGASKEQEAAEEDGHGFFTQSLVEGLGGKADYNKDGVVELYELQLYVHGRVRELSAEEQEPTVSIPSVVKSFALSKP